MGWLERHQEYAILFVPLFAFLETCFVVGIFVSSLFLVIACSIIYANGWAELWLMCLLAMLGSSLADHLGFYIGRGLGPGFHHLRLVERNRKKIDKAEALVRRFGPGAIFIGRFIPAIRSLVPAMMGLTGFARTRYTPLDLSACGLWACGLYAIVLGAHELFLAQS